MLDFSAREEQFLEHLAPVWNALTDEERGTFFVTHRVLAERARRLNVKTKSGGISDERNLTVVSAFGDMARARKAGRPVILMEHGAGQGYVQDDGRPVLSGSYNGSTDRRGVRGVLLPGEPQLAKHRERHPDIPGFAVGCPKLDRWHLRGVAKERRGLPVVALSFHWDCTVVPETRTSLRHFRYALPRLAERTDIKVIGHGHPRALGVVRRHYLRYGIEFVPDLEEVFERADLYICDNSSSMFEFASLDRPVVVLNPAIYRRHINHGMRFWEYADMGVQCDRHEDLNAAIDLALTDPSSVADRRREIVAQVYAVTDGTASERAVEAIRSLA